MNTAGVAHLLELCAEHGATLLQDVDGVLVTKHVPISAQPLMFTPDAVDLAQRLMVVWNKLVDCASRDPAWLLQVLRGSDPEFTERMLDIMERVYVKRDPSAWEQRAMLGIFRSDYLLDAAAASNGLIGENGNPLRHVEINTMACAFAGLSTRVGLVHQGLQANAPALQTLVSDSETNVSKALVEAHLWWCNQNTTDATIVIVVQQGERNSVDQELLIKRVTEMGASAVRLTLKQIGDMTVDESSTAKVALADGTVKAVSVFYHRALYDLRDFPDEEAWVTRERLERTNAIKCPSLPYHMCGCKRVQQAFTRREVLTKFVTDDEATLLLRCMVPQYLLHDDSEATQIAVADAITNPSKYVIKTQEEATGRLFSGQTVVDMLSVSPSDPRYTRIRHDHLLMERIVGLKLRGELVRDGAVTQEELESEFGTYGTIFSDGDAIISNVSAGYVVRTKAAASEGGGVMSGVSVLDAIAVRR